MKKNKILSFAEAEAVLDAKRRNGRRIVQCHGTFDLIHPGHIVHLEEARALGDLLVVTVTDEKHVNKGPGRPCFNDPLRARTLAALECVDYVVLIPYVAAVEAIRLVKPAIYCKGTEYQDTSNDVTGNIHDDLSEVRAHGGEVRYIGSVVFSSTKILNRHFDHLPQAVRDYCSQLSSKTSASRSPPSLNSALRSPGRNLPPRRFAPSFASQDSSHGTRNSCLFCKISPDAKNWPRFGPHQSRNLCLRSGPF